MNERQVFEGALEILDLVRRQAFLVQACGADAELRSRVDALLLAHAANSQFMEVPAVQLGQSDSNSQDKTLEAQPQHPAGNEDDGSDDSTLTGPNLSFLQPSTKPGSIGTLGHYEIQNVLGQGGFGIVFKAFDEKLHRLVAIKCMNSDLAVTSPPRKRFLREARAAAGIRHENVVQVHSVEEQPLPYLVMEFIDGQTLQQTLNGAGPLTIGEILHLGRQIAQGLAAAHALGLIHRDIKPANILLEQGAEQRVKITDFGLARAADDASLTRTGVVSGTPLYMSPEQAKGGSIDHRSDLFSLGSVLYVMACGRAPFRAPSVLAVLRRVAEETPRPIGEILPEVPGWLVAIINKLLAKQPEDRFQSAKEVADLLAKCQAELQLLGSVKPIPGLPEPVPAAAVAPPSPPPVPQTTAAPAAAPNRRRWLVLPAVLLTLLAGLGLSEWTGLTHLRQSLFRVTPQEVAVVPVPAQVAQGVAPQTGWHGWPADAPQPAIAPFDAAQARQHQEAWAAYLKVPVEHTNSVGMEFRKSGSDSVDSGPSSIVRPASLQHDDHRRHMIHANRALSCIR